MNKLLFILNKFFRKTRPSSAIQTKIIARSDHPISRKQISPQALKVLYRLRDAGFAAYLVGGCVRDLLLGREPKDFDVATNATPEQVQQLFRNAILIGRRFRLAHVRFHGEIIEVATFRQGGEQGSETKSNEHGMLMRDNLYGSIEEDVLRRDFTVNAFYYNIADFSVVDLLNGMPDLHANSLKIIGEPLLRFREDPVRILRAIRFAAKLSFHLEANTAQAIPQTADLLAHISSARLFDEVLKLLSAGYGEKTFALLRQHDLLKYLFGQTDTLLQHPDLHGEFDHFLIAMLRNTDDRIAQEKGVNPAFMLASMLWYPLQQAKQALLTQELPLMVAHEQATNEVITKQLKQIAIPRRFTNTMREIWLMQYQLEKCRPHRIQAIFYSARFRAAYDFLLLRAIADPAMQNKASWWTEFVDADEEKRAELIKDLNKTKKRPRRKKPAAKPAEPATDAST